MNEDEARGLELRRVTVETDAGYERRRVRPYRLVENDYFEEDTGNGEAV